MTRQTLIRVVTMIVFLVFVQPAHAKWTNVSWVMDDQSLYMAVAASSDSHACVAGFTQATGNPEVIFGCTTDGETWTPVQVSTIPACMIFVDNALGFFGGILGQVWRTDDGGATWAKAEGAKVTGSLADLSMTLDGSVIAAAGSNGSLTLSTDRGASWSSASATLPAGEASANAVDALPGGLVWMAGGDLGEAPSEGSEFEDPTPGRPPGQGFVLFSNDSGATFETLASALPYCVYDMDFVNAAEGWIAAGGAANGEGRIAYTTDGGKSWTDVTIPDLPDEERTFVNQTEGGITTCRRIRFYSRLVGLALCDTATLEYDGYNGLYLTLDGGRTWTLEPGFKAAFGEGTGAALKPATAALDMSMPTCTHGYVVGEKLLIHRYDADDSDRDCAQGGTDGGAAVDAGGDGGDGDERRDDSSCDCGQVGRTRRPGRVGRVFQTLFFM